MAATRTSRTKAAHRNTGRPPRDEMYIHGNTVRKLAPEEEPLERPEREPEHRNRRRTSYAVRRNREKALQLDLPYLLMLVAASCVTLYFCVSYLHLQSEMTARVDNIKNLESQLEVLKSENDALETRINTSIDLDHIYRVATEELGMVYAGQDQVLLYNRTESEYVRQNEDIPEYD